MTPSELKNHRKALKLSQGELARELCVTRRAVVSWETGSRNMPPCVEKLFCLLYNLPYVPSPGSSVPDDRTPDLF